ncbi:RNA polymerase I enhancer binding protein [Coemansia nantahalensis]|uniref:RNA polymerase I enhancer binding protein n=1 Tax=Coemansia nantahalensis TaxID=2789366 RepID=A0ACC1K1Z4_9FUNG|nr:RNA polymerase I enhancer binding protein [Coemansia nantahalensis]
MDCDRGPRREAPQDADATALAELLRVYPGLLGGPVEVVARALAQATLAASKIASSGSGSGAMSAVDRVRLGRSLAQAAAAATDAYARSSEAAAAAAAAGSSGDGDRAGQRRRRRRAARRWHTQAHIERLQSEGVVFRKGKFTAEENAVIDDAVAAFVEMHELTAAEIYERLFQHGEHAAAKQVRRAFWPVLAEALPERQVQAIYHHVRRKFHPHNYQGAWTPAEDGELRRLVAAHGPAWEAISRQLGRMGTNCRDRWRYIQGALRPAPRRRVAPAAAPDPDSPAAAAP